MSETNVIKEITRNKNGLIEGFEYKFTEEGLIDWRGMIPSKYLYINPSNKTRIEKKYGKPYDELDPINDKIEDIDLVQLLAATKYLLRLRGYESVESLIKESNENYASVNCKIKFVPNFETEGRVIIYSENACANLQNTNGFGQKYLVEMATNRALARCTRNFLNINIVSKEELSGGNEYESNQNSNDSQVTALIEKVDREMKKRNISFEQLKNVILIGKDKLQGAENFKSLEDCPRDKLFNLYDRLKKVPVKKNEGKEEKPEDETEDFQ